MGLQGRWAQRRWIWGVALLAGLFSALAVSLDPALLRMARERIFDQYQRIAPRQADGAVSVKVVEIDDAALAQYGQWPWPRSMMASLVDKLHAAGASAIVFDIIFAEPDRMSPMRLYKQWSDDQVLSVEAASALAVLDDAGLDYDRRFASAIEQAPVILHLTTGSNTQAAAECPKPLAPSRLHGILPEQLAAISPSYADVIASLPPLRAAAKGEGLARSRLREDAIIREVPLIALACRGEEIYPALALEALRVAASGQQSSKPCVSRVFSLANGGIDRIRLCGRTIATQRDGSIRIHFTERGQMQRRRAGVSVSEVLTQDVQTLRASVEGRIIFIGATAEGLRDVRMTPRGDERPGVHIHAAIVEQILQNHFLMRDSQAMQPVEMVVGAGLAVLFVGLLSFLSAMAGSIIFSIIMILVFAGGFFLFTSAGVLFDPVAIALMAGGPFIAAFVVSFQQEQHSRAFIREAFGTFLSPLLLDRLEKDPSLLRLEGETRHITAFFSDIRGFTQMAERMSAMDLTRFLNRYFGEMGNIITQHDGLIDKFMGDGIAAMWNAPLDIADHTQKAARASLAMLKALENLNQEWQQDSLLPTDNIRIGIGLHAGEAIVGNFGSEDHFEYSMLGDAVNLAARLESLTKEFDVPIIVSAEAAAFLGEFALISLGPVTVRGRQEKVEIFALLGDRDMQKTPAFQSYKSEFECGVSAYRNGALSTAETAFSACLAARVGWLDHLAQNILAQEEK